jgi:hypothetical protein
VTKVNINGVGHQVEIHHEGADLTYVVEKAQKLWDETKPADAKSGPAFGYSAEREHRRDGFAWGMGAGEQPTVKP